MQQKRGTGKDDDVFLYPLILRQRTPSLPVKRHPTDGAVLTVTPSRIYGLPSLIS